MIARQVRTALLRVRQKIKQVLDREKRPRDTLEHHLKQLAAAGLRRCSIHAGHGMSFGFGDTWPITYLISRNTQYPSYIINFNAICCSASTPPEPRCRHLDERFLKFKCEVPESVMTRTQDKKVGLKLFIKTIKKHDRARLFLTNMLRGAARRI